MNTWMAASRRAAPLLAAAVLASGLASAQEARPERPFVCDPGDHATAEEHVNALREAAENPAAPTAWEDLPDWSGLWTRDIGAEGFSVRPGEPLTGVGLRTEIGMKLTPEHQARYDKMIADHQAGRGDWDLLSWCLPAGDPRWHVEPFLKEFVLRPGYTLPISEQQSEVRRIYTDGRGHVPEEMAFPMRTGDSIGFRDDQTLVIRTDNVKANIYQRQQPELSDQLETVEKRTEIEPGVMEVRMAIHDPVAPQEPFPLIRHFYQIDDQNGDLRIALWSCNENNVVQTAEGNTRFVLPGEEGYRPAVTDSASPADLGTATEQN